MFGRMKKVVWAVVGMLLFAGCGNGGDDPTAMGAVSMSVTMQDGTQVLSIDWVINDSNGDEVKSGTIDVSDPSIEVSTFIVGVPAGAGYVMTLSADLVDEDGNDIGDCTQSAVFDVTAGEITRLAMTLNCSPDDGSVEVEVDFNVCPVIDSIIVTGLIQTVGEDISLAAFASDADGDAVTYEWTASVGSVTDADQSNAVYTCIAAGDVVLTLSVKDNVVAADDQSVCDTQTNVTVTCEPAGVCGDGVIDAGEECDDGNSVDGDGCQADCTVTDSCDDVCSPTNCTDYQDLNVFDACYGDDASDAALCGAVMECAHETGCVMYDASGNLWSEPSPRNCYCGAASLMNCMTGSAEGECKDEMEAAAGTDDPMTLATLFTNSEYAIGDAYLLLQCEQTSCADECF